MDPESFDSSIAPPALLADKDIGGMDPSDWCPTLTWEALAEVDDDDEDDEYDDEKFEEGALDACLDEPAADCFDVDVVAVGAAPDENPPLFLRFCSVACAAIAELVEAAVGER